MFSPDSIIANGSLFLIALVVFAETGLLIGVVLPGDTLLFSAGIFAATGKFNIYALLATVIVSAIVGDNVGYSFGKRAGPRLFKKEDGILLNKEHIVKAEKFFDAHGGKTVILARFIPAIRTVAPMIAGMGKMDRKTFFRYNVVGALVWGGGVTLLGYFFGSKIPNVEKYVIPAFLLANLFTWGPVAFKAYKNPKVRAKVVSKLRLIFRRVSAS
jgi:membrane-associated protein